MPELVATLPIPETLMLLTAPSSREMAMALLVLKELLNVDTAVPPLLAAAVP
ncbi:hypothetical protein ACQCRT_23975 [Ralstonia pseudosolanacearum]|uniref:hypothetical protein n=1 Tax=Ralstonia pseudosolanacearum TaxID=1310165 RepID=UPI003CF1E4E9